MYKGRNKLNNRIVAIKILALENALTNISDLWKEVISMKLCNHPNVLCCYCCFCVQDRLWIVTPFMEKGSLLRILQYQKEQGMIDAAEGFDVEYGFPYHLQENVVAAVIKQVAYGLRYLHGANLLHRYLSSLSYSVETLRQGIFLLIQWDGSALLILVLRVSWRVL